MSSERVQRAARYLAELRRPGPRPKSLPADLAPQSELEAYQMQAAVASALGARLGCWKVAMNEERSGTCAPIFAADVHRTGAHVHPLISKVVGIEPEVAFTLKRALPPLPAGQRYGREQVIEAIGAAHAAIEIVISRFQSHEGAAPMDRLADSLSNEGLVLGPACEAWRELNLGTLPLHVTIDEGNDEVSVYDSRGGHPLNDPLVPLVWLVNHCSARGSGMQSGNVVTTGSYAGLRYAGRGAHVKVQFEGLGAAELYS
jgi:2-keto-4-pentenoate hydratase